MKMLKHVFTGRRPATTDEYADLEHGNPEPIEMPASTELRIAEITTQHDLHRAQEELYDGNIVLVDFREGGASREHIMEQLHATVKEVDGDIIRKGDDQLIVTPRAVRINREKLGPNAE